MSGLSTVKVPVNEIFRYPRCDEEGNLSILPSIPGFPFQFFLSSNGDGTGTINLNGDYSASVTLFKYTATSRFDAYSLLVSVSDTTSFNQTDFGGIPLGLTNGVKLVLILQDGITEVPLMSTGLVPIKQNYQWYSIFSDVKLTTFVGTPQTLSVLFSLVDTFGKPFCLETGQSIAVKLNDNLTGLVAHTYHLRGILY